MSITGQRIQKKLEKQRRNDKRFTKSSLLLITIGALVVGGVSSTVVYKYQKTKHWESTVLTKSYDKLPPELVSNHISRNDIKRAKEIVELSDFITSLQKKEGLSASDKTTIKDYLKDEKRLTKGLTSTDLKDKFAYLHWLTDTENFIESAYNNPNSQTLNNLIGQSSKYGSSIDNNYKKQLSSIGDDYTALNKFLDETIQVLGSFTNNTLTIKTAVDASDTKLMIKAMDKNDLTRFKPVKKFKELLESDKYQKLLDSNRRYQDKQAWLKYKAAFESLTKSQFYPASSIKTLEDARSLGLSVTNADNRQGYVLQPNSKVTKLTLSDGTTVHEDQYIKYGTPLNVTIAATYMKLPESSSSSSSSSSSRTSSSSSSSTTYSSSMPSRTESSSSQTDSYPYDNSTTGDAASN